MLTPSWLEYTTEPYTHRKKDNKQINPYNCDSHNAHEAETSTQITEGFGGSKPIFVTTRLLNFAAKVEQIQTRHKIDARKNKVNQCNNWAKTTV